MICITQEYFFQQNVTLFDLYFTFGWTLIWMWMPSEKKGGASWRSVPGASPWPPICKNNNVSLKQHTFTLESENIILQQIDLMLSLI